MSHYSDCYYEEHKHEFEREAKAKNFRERLTVELSCDDMIKIMFADFIKCKGVFDVIRIGEKYLKDENLD